MKLIKLLLTAIFLYIFINQGIGFAVEENWYYHINDHLGSCRTVLRIITAPL